MRNYINIYSQAELIFEVNSFQTQVVLIIRYQIGLGGKNKYFYLSPDHWYIMEIT